MPHRYSDRCKLCPAYGWRAFLPKWVGRECPACAGRWLAALAPDGRITALRRRLDAPQPGTIHYPTEASAAAARRGRMLAELEPARKAAARPGPGLDLLAALLRPES